MKVGDLVKYNDKYTTGLLVGIILEIDDEFGWSNAPYRVRWSDHMDTQRDWYQPNELILL